MPNSDEYRHGPIPGSWRTLLCLDCRAARRVYFGARPCHECGGANTKTISHKVRIPKRNASEKTWQEFLDRFVRDTNYRRAIYNFRLRFIR